MSIVGVLRLFRVDPKHPVGPEGQMALADHLRELRARVMIATVTVFVGMVVAWFFYDQLNSLLLDPYRRAGRRPPRRPRRVFSLHPPFRGRR